MHIKIARNSEQDVSDLGVHDHPCSLYETAEQLKQQFVPYLQAGLALGEMCVYFVDENTEEFVMEAMQLNGFDLEPYIVSRQFQVINTRDAHLKEDYFGEEKMLSYWKQAMAESMSRGFTALRAAVEMTWALSGKPGCDILAPYESRLTNLMSENNASVICMYSRKKFSAEKIKAIIHAHPIVVTDDVVLKNTSCPKPERFVEGCANLDVQALLDNLALIQRLTDANTQLEQQKQEYATLYEELHQLARVVSHEMQGPLSLIISYLRLLTVRYAGKLGPDAEEFMRTMNDAAEILLQMIDDLWSYARVDSGEHDDESVESLIVFGEALQDLKGLIKASSAEIVYGEMPLLHCKRRNLRFVFKAVIENACKYSQFGVRPLVQVTVVDHQDGWLFKIKDNGKGIEPVRKSEVFKIFQRLDGRPSKEGTGMGLAIAKRIVEHQGGRIWLESELGKGTSIYFTVPKLDADQKVRYMRDFIEHKQAHEA